MLPSFVVNGRLSKYCAFIEPWAKMIVSPLRIFPMPSPTTRTSKKPVMRRKPATRDAPSKKDPDIVSPKSRLVTPASEIDGLTGDPNFMTSLARGLAVIRAFTQQRRHLTIAQLSQRTAIPRAAVRRCLYTLAKLGYVAADEARGYSLRPGILALGHAYLSSTPLATMVQPLLDRVSDALHESSSMAVLESDEILYIARSTTTTRLMSIDLGIGSRLPAYCSSMGRVLLAALTPPELDAYLSRVSLTRLTNRTVTSAVELKRVLDEVRRNGFSVVDQELEIGLRSIGVPVTDPSGKVIASINVGTQSARVSVAEMESRFLPALSHAARELGTLLPR
jgi:IclR family pca regulon transcriptional regulator